MRSSPTGKELDLIVHTVRQLVKEEQNVAGLKCWKTDEYLLRYIRASNYDPQASFLLIKKYFKAKLDNPDAFVIRSPAAHLEMFKRKDLGLPLKGLDKCQRRVMNIKFGLIDPDKENWLSFVQASTVLYEAFSLEEDVQENGLAFIDDCAGFSLKLMKWATPYRLKTMLGFFQDSFPIRFEVIHVVNYPNIFQVFYSAVKPFLNNGFKKTLIWHSDLSTLAEHIDKSVLPTHLGGQADAEENTDWYNFVLERENIFSEFRKMGYPK